VDVYETVQGRCRGNMLGRRKEGVSRKVRGKFPYIDTVVSTVLSLSLGPSLEAYTFLLFLLKFRRDRYDCG
jgi:hypothetical protein